MTLTTLIAYGLFCFFAGYVGRAAQEKINKERNV